MALDLKTKPAFYLSAQDLLELKDLFPKLHFTEEIDTYGRAFMVLARYRATGPEPVVDNTRINELEAMVESLTQRNDELSESFLNDTEVETGQLKEEIARLKADTKRLTRENTQLVEKSDKLETFSNETVSKLKTEVENWKNKFTGLKLKIVDLVESGWSSSYIIKELNKLFP